MTKDEGGSRRSASTTRGRGPYVLEACRVCRIRKIRCDGAKPKCGRCVQSDRQYECSWGKESVMRKKTRTEALFEAVYKRTEALKVYILHLETLLERCHREHGGFPENEPSYLQLRPKELDPSQLLNQDTYPASADHESGSDSEDDITNQLCRPTQSLTLDKEGLLQHGNTAIFRFTAPEEPSETSHLPAKIVDPNASYVLLGEGVDDDNAGVDWSRYLPDDAHIDREEHDKVLGLFFKFFTSWCQRMMPDLFLRDMYRALSGPWSPKTSHYSPMLHNALLALATAFSDDPQVRDMNARLSLLNAAKARIEDDCRKPDLCVVHALSFIATFHSSQGEQTLGYLYFGMSARITLALGLNVDCSPWVASGSLTEQDRVNRNWVYWTMFSQDVCWCLYVGRECSVPMLSPSQNIPIPFVDSDLDQKLWYHFPTNVKPQPNLSPKTFASTCELMIIARRVMDMVNDQSRTRTRNVLNDEIVSDIDLKLNSWKDSLPPEVDLTNKTKATATPHRLMLHLAYWWLFILLHRPLYHRKPKLIHSSDRDIDHVKLCRRAADHIVDLMGIWKDLYTHRYGPLGKVQPMFAAGTIYLLSAVQATQGARLAHKELKHSLDQMRVCAQALYDMGKSFPAATNIGNMLEHLIQVQLKPLIERRVAVRFQTPPVKRSQQIQPGLLPSGANRRASVGSDALDERVALGQSSKQARTPSGSPGSLHNTITPISATYTSEYERLPQQLPNTSMSHPADLAAFAPMHIQVPGHPFSTSSSADVEGYPQVSAFGGYADQEAPALQTVYSDQDGPVNSDITTTRAHSHTLPHPHPHPQTHPMHYINYAQGRQFMPDEAGNPSQSAILSGGMFSVAPFISPFAQDGHNEAGWAFSLNAVESSDDANASPELSQSMGLVPPIVLSEAKQHAPAEAHKPFMTGDPAMDMDWEMLKEVWDSHFVQSVNFGA